MRRRDVHTKMGNNGAVVADAVGQQWYVPVCFQIHPYDAVHVAKRGSAVKIKERSMSTGEWEIPLSTLGIVSIGGLTSDFSDMVTPPFLEPNQRVLASRRRVKSTKGWC